MNNLIEIKLQVTALQLTAIARILAGDNSTIASVTFADIAAAVEVDETAVVTDTDTPAAAVIPAPPVTVYETDDEGSNAGSLFAKTETPASVETAKGLNGQHIPWDARIHGSAKKTNADGSWRLKQGVDREGLVIQVEAELVAALTSAPTVTDTSAPVATGQVVPPPPVAVTTFAELLPVVTAAKAAGTLTDEKVAEVCANPLINLASFGLIATRPDLIPLMVQLLGV